VVYNADEMHIVTSERLHGFIICTGTCGAHKILKYRVQISSDVEFWWCRCGEDGDTR
jgi:hypothetical protein